MFSSFGLIGVAILLAFVGMLTACFYTLVLGIAGIPGALLTKALSKTNDGELILSTLGLFLTVAGQTYASLAFVVLIVLSVHSWTDEALGIGKWILWFVAFCVSIAPIWMALKDSSAKWRKYFIGSSPGAISHYEATTFTLPLTIIGFFIFALFPRLSLWGWGWIPHF